MQWNFEGHVVDAEALWAEGERRFTSGELDAAADAYRRLRGHGQFGALAALRLSLIASRIGDFRTAVGEARAALGRLLPDPVVMELVAKRLLSLGEKELALDVVERLLRLPAVPVPTLAELGKMLSDGDEPVAALGLLRRAEAAGWSSAAMHYLIGLSTMYTGDATQARERLETSLRMDATFAPAHWALVKLDRRDEGGRHRNHLLAAIGQLADGHPDLPVLLYALFHRLDAEGDTEAAWRILARAMKARRHQLRYDPAAEQRMFRMLETVAADPELAPDDHPLPIFIVGLPRTGTTLLDQLLGRNANVARAGELRDFNWALRFQASLGGPPLLDERLVATLAGGTVRGLGGDYLRRTKWRAAGKRYFTDKLPPNFMNIGWIGSGLPQARIIHVVRNPMDACFSNLKELFAAPYPHSYDMGEMAGHYVRYRRLMKVWHDRFPGRIVDVAYESLVRDPEGVVAAVQEQCGLDGFDDATGGARGLEVIATASAMQVREPVHERGIGAWRRYAAQLAPLQEALADAGLL